MKGGIKLSDYQIGKRIEGFFAVIKAGLGNARNGSRYLDLRLGDGRQEIPAKQWEYKGAVPRENTIIKVQAMADNYQGQIQFVVQKWEEAQPGECDPGRFIPVCPRNKEDLLDDFFGLVESVKDNDYLCLLENFINSLAFKSFIVAPGAKTIHHAYLHGLLEHSVDVAKKALAIADDATNKDLLITGALLHDIGKIHEFDWSGCIINRTAPGKLVGHIALGLIIIDGLNREARDTEKHLLLCHLVASHHGNREWGALVEPQTKEAVILHTADMLDFQFNAIDKAVAGATPGCEWTGKAAGIGREFYVGKLVANEES